MDLPGTGRRPTSWPSAPENQPEGPHSQGTRSRVRGSPWHPATGHRRHRVQAPAALRGRHAARKTRKKGHRLASGPRIKATVDRTEAGGGAKERAPEGRAEEFPGNAPPRPRGPRASREAAVSIRAIRATRKGSRRIVKGRAAADGRNSGRKPRRPDRDRNRDPGPETSASAGAAGSAWSRAAASPHRGEPSQQPADASARRNPRRCGALICRIGTHRER